MSKLAEQTADMASGTPERILLAAEKLFSERGIDAVSLREITAAAGVNTAAAHYHFGSKEAVLKELFSRRAQPIADRREELLGQLEPDTSGRPVLEDILAAFLRPGLEALGTPDGMAFSMMRARMAFEREEVRRAALSQAFNRTSEMALKALAKALPDLPNHTLHWRFHFLLGSMVYTMAMPGRIESITHDGIDTVEPETALAELVRFAAAGFRAP
ncbi:TetR/AcrR family transcriptional regulator [Tardiphaga sp. vice352]|uniref:TetR/AcrR family transcriptional regulator n=1 Tax=unclassified Tardiphaga TaxID=2631404 RepID=UPI001165C66D|nr:MULTISPECIES: TetR/AcrR family transcriptional regulator [unclassified Tardiphaga]QDM14756.1 TetR/AcrR family transcriptional regulator [Tardiphaga sp. vice278]QDM24935.1 TetR/AcrR family transcriptional regulator [Tardiphaga sp. vice304]QDM30145.1 TetR/AcrR family transcriptional regulator [Tardiphaga sp. vice352]